MPLAKCVRCDKLFDKRELPVCPTCQPDEEDDYHRMRDVLQEKPGLNAEELAEESGVAFECVLRMLEQGRISSLTLSEPVKCGRCGAPAISLTKKLCAACLQKLNQEMVEARRAIKLSDKKTPDLGVRDSVDQKRRGK